MAWQMPHPGQLRQSVRFERAGAAGANVGGVTTSDWTSPTVVIPNRAALLEPTRGGAEMIAGRLSGKTVYDLWVRSDSQTRAVLLTDRAVNNLTGEIYALSPPLDPDGRRKWLLFQATSSGIVPTPT